MNEVELIRGQLTLERQHAAEVARACASALEVAGSPGTERLASLEAFRQAGVDYLVWMLSRFEEREQVFHDLLRGRCPTEDPNRRAVETALALPGTSREALAKLEAALGPTVESGSTAAPAGDSLAPAGGSFADRSVAGRSVAPAGDSLAGRSVARWSDFLRFFSGAWSARRDEIDRLFERQAKVTDWRTVSDIDADSIVDERSRYARVKATLPAGIEMSPAASRL
jgi:hypothetical protein